MGGPEFIDGRYTRANDQCSDVLAVTSFAPDGNCPRNDAENFERMSRGGRGWPGACPESKRATLAPETTASLRRTMNAAERIKDRDHDTPTAPTGTGGPGTMMTGDAVSRLDFLTLLRVSGDDAHAFLQGQLTADIDEVDASTSRLAAWCSPRGRVLALFRLFADPLGGYRVVCERWVAATLLARIRMFILRSDVKIDDASTELEVAGIAGARTLPDPFAAWAEAAGVDDAVTYEETTISRVPGRGRRFLLTGTQTRVDSIASARKGGSVRQASAGAWRLADICAGVPRITAKSSDAFLPQMLNLDRFHAVSFEKGCYVGQEIVARAQHLGRVKRRAYVGRTHAAAEGDPILETAENDARKVGDIVAVEPHPDGDSAALVVLNVDSAESPALRVSRNDGPPIRVSSPEVTESPV